MRYALTDAEWRFNEPILPCKPRGVPRVDDRRVLNGMFSILKSGAPWRDLPEPYGPYTTCYNRFVRWRRAGVWYCALAVISHREWSDVQMIESTIVRAHQHATCTKHCHTEELGRSRSVAVLAIDAARAVGPNVRVVHMPGALKPTEIGLGLCRWRECPVMPIDFSARQTAAEVKISLMRSFRPTACPVRSASVVAPS